MANKKICILTSVHHALDVRIFHKEAKTLANAGYDVSLIAQHDKEEIVDGIRIIPLPKPKNRLVRMLFLTRKAYKLALEQKADIYHFHDPELLPRMLKLKKKTKAKIIYDVHEDVPKQILSKHWIPEILRKPAACIFNIYEKSIAKKFDYVITATPHIKENFTQKNVIDIKNYPVVQNLKNFKNQNESKKNDFFTLIYAGGLSRLRGIKEIIQSLNFVSPKYPIRLQLLGEFDDKIFEQEIRRLKKWEKVDFLGWVPQKETIKHLSGAGIGLVCFWPEPNHINAMPNKIFEYAIAGLPIIASNFPLWKEIIEGNNCGICVNPLNPKEIAKAIEYLIEHPNEAKIMGENGRKAVLEKYNWENESKKLLEVYEELAK